MFSLNVQYVTFSPSLKLERLQVQSPLKRAAMGGFCFVGAKGVLKIYHKQNQYIRQCKRQILDYNVPS